MARRSQCSSAGDNPLDPNYLPPHYREEYRLAIDALIEEDLEGYYQFLQKADVVDFLSSPEIQYIQESVQVPQQSTHPEQRFLETDGDGSSDTYWPVHSDLDAPGLDLGWPQMHHLIGPAEVTTLVNPPEPDMPSIKEQARRLIKNARQVIAVVMDMFTDVDILHDILSAAMRNVAVYILLDKQNAHHFINMVSNCRVNLHSIQFLRVRTVSGITYHCRSGKSFKGQMMDRFLLTDCRAVLSGNYSFMWSFEKLHRCMAHLFLGQLVSTFDEEFRILYAQSQPLVIENELGPVEDFSLLQKRPYLRERPSLYREPRKFLSQDTAHPDDWARHSYDEHMDVDWRLMPLRKESMHGPPDIYNRFSSQQANMDPNFDQGHSRVPMLENPSFKRHSYAEGVHGRYSYPFQPQQGMPEAENQGRQFHRSQQLYPGTGPGPGKEPDYGAHEKFWNQDYLLGDQYSEPGLPQEIGPPDNFDPVLNYLSSTRNVDFDQGSEKLPPAADVPFSSSHPRRLSLGQPYTCQTSPTPSNPTEQKQFFLEPSTDRKDPLVKRGLRDWRISSYLSAYDNPGDEGLPLAPPNIADAFGEPSNIIQQTTSGIDVSAPKIPNVREFRVPAIPRASQMPSYIKTMVREQPKKLPDEPTAVAAETKTTPTPSESSSTTDVENSEEAEPKEPKTAVVHREESFRRKYNAAVQRSSRLRSSLIFSSLDQQHTSQDNKTAPGQQDEENDKNETEQTKQPLVSQVLGQRRSTAREPFEWRRYMKSATFDNSATDSSKPDDESSKVDDKDSSKKDESSKDLSEKKEVQESLKLPDSSPSMPQSKPSEAELPKTDQPPKSLLTNPSYIDMNDPDLRLMFFKELAAKRKVAKAAEAEKSKEKVPMKPQTEVKNTTTVKTDETIQQDAAKKMADTVTSESLSEKNASAENAGKTESTEVSLSEPSDKTHKEDSQVKSNLDTAESCKDEQSRVLVDSEKTEQNYSQPASALSVSAEPETPQSVSPEEPKLASPAVETSSSSHPPTPTDAAPVDVPALTQGPDESQSCLEATSKESSSLTPSSMEVPSSSFDASDSHTQSETSFSSPPLQSDQHTGSEFSSSNLSPQSFSPDYILPDSDSHISPSLSPSSPTVFYTPTETIALTTFTPEDSSSLFSNAEETVTPLAHAVESIPVHPDSVSQLTSSETSSAVDSACLESDISPEACVAASEPNTTLLESTSQIHMDPEESPAPFEKDVPEAENKSAPQVAGEQSEILGSSEDVKADSTPPSLSPPPPEPCLPNVSDLKSKSRSDQNEIITPTSSPADSSPEYFMAETTSPVHLDLTPNAPQTEATASPQDPLDQVTPPTKPHLTGPATPSPAETASSSCSCSSPLTESVGSVLSPEAKKTLSTLHSFSDTNSPPGQVTTETSPTEPTSNDTTEADLPCKTPVSVTSEFQPSESPGPAENRNMESQNEVSQEPEIPDPAERKSDDTDDPDKVNTTPAQESACSEKINDQVGQNNSSEVPEITSGEAVSPSPQSKQPKSSQTRYQSSTANVLSSSNLRDDTKLLLEQISANSQSRNEATKEAPVTDDEKEDEAGKHAKREKERGLRSLSRGQPKANQEREKLLERIQSMRKERKVYSRFEMAP